MSDKLTVCGIDLDLFANGLDVSEMAAIFARMTDFDQARFLAAAMFELRKVCKSEFHADTQLRNVGKMLTGAHLDSPLKAEARAFIDRVQEGIEDNSHKSAA